MEQAVKKKPPLWYALLAFLIPVGIILYGILVLKIRPPVLPLVIATAAAGLLCLPLGYRWKELQEGMFEAVSRIQIALCILIMVGVLIPAWMASGTIPAIIYWGLKLIEPGYFLVSSMVLCAVASMATGSSFGCMGTVGVALLGIGTAMGYPPAMTVGAIVSGAYIGDKMSPISDTTNIAASVCEVNLFRHIYSMLYTTVPAFIFAGIMYLILGSKTGAAIDPNVEGITAIFTGIEANYPLSPIVFLPLVILFGLAFFRVAVLPTMMASLAVAVVIGLFNGVPAMKLAAFMTTGYKAATGLAMLDKLLSLGGILSVAPTMLLCYCGICLGGILEKGGILEVLIAAMLRGAQSTLRLVMSAIAAGYIILLGTGAQMLALIIPGRAFADSFKKANIDAAVLSRCCEDSGTIGSPLVPWSVHAFFILGVLGVNAYEFGPYAFLCWSVPIFSAILAITGIGIWDRNGKSYWRLKREGIDPRAPENASAEAE